MSSFPEQVARAAVATTGHLKRALGLWMLVFYGLGTIVGAGIYIVVGEVAKQAGMATPLAFLAAGLAALCTGFAYAELSARFPEAAGAAAYVAEGFHSKLPARVTGVIVLVTGVVIAASLARGAAGYLAEFVPFSIPALSGAFVVLFTAIACLNVRESVGLTAALTIVETLGLVLVIAAGAPAILDFSNKTGGMIPSGAGEWTGAAAGAFLAFFAYIGFEGLANMAEEARNPKRDLPRAIILSIAISAVLYASVAMVAVLAVPLDRLTESNAPLALVIASSNWAAPELLVVMALIAIPNGLLADLLMTARLLYGMSKRDLAPAWLSLVAPATQTPIFATLAAGAATVVFAIAVPFEHLVAATSATTLLVFIMVNLALWRLHGARGAHVGLRAPRWMPPLAVGFCVALLLAQVSSW